MDFVVYGAAGFWAIEVENTDRVRPEDLRGLLAFATDYPQAEVVMPLGFLGRGGQDRPI